MGFSSEAILSKSAIKEGIFKMHIHIGVTMYLFD